jgi:hypothetical protein
MGQFPKTNMFIDSNGHGNRANTSVGFQEYDTHSKLTSPSGMNMNFRSVMQPTPQNGLRKSVNLPKMDKKASIVFDTKRSLERLKNGTGTPKMISRIGVAHTFFCKQGVFSGPSKKHVRNLPSIQLLNKSYDSSALGSKNSNNHRDFLGK